MNFLSLFDNRWFFHSIKEKLIKKLLNKNLVEEIRLPPYQQVSINRLKEEVLCLLLYGKQFCRLPLLYPLIEAILEIQKENL